MNYEHGDLTDPLDLAPGPWRDHGLTDCDRRECNEVFRASKGCPIHGRRALAEECLRSIELERQLTITLAGPTTDELKLKRIDSLARRAAIVRGYIARHF